MYRWENGQGFWDHPRLCVHSGPLTLGRLRITKKGLTASVHSPLESLITQQCRWAARKHGVTHINIKTRTSTPVHFNYKRQMLDDRIAAGNISSRPVLVHYHALNITDVNFWAKPSPQITTHHITLSYDNLLRTHAHKHTKYHICNFPPELYFMLLKHKQAQSDHGIWTPVFPNRPLSLQLGRYQEQDLR